MIHYHGFFKKRRYEWESSESWRLADDQYRYFSNPENGYINGEVIKISTFSDLQNVANTGGVQAGDLVFFSSNGTTVYHAAMVSKVENGMIYYTAHTSSQFNCPLGDKIDSSMVFIVRIYDNA